jgi:quercetin dioxygenase-like cupin family protein
MPPRSSQPSRRSLESSTTIIGQPIAYPAGTAKVTAAIITIPPGGETGWHTHAVPLFGYMLDGELTVDYGIQGTRVYKVGDSLLEAMNWPHDGMNKGTVPVRILAVYMGAEGMPNAEPVPQ